MKPCGAGKDSWEFLGPQGNQTSQPERKSMLNIHWKDWCWSWNANTLTTCCEEPTHWKRPWFWERLKAGGEGTTEDEMVGWYHQLNGHEFEQTTGVSEGQGILECWSSWGCKESGHDLATEQKQEMKSWKEKSARWCLDLQWFSEERHG